MIYLTTCCAHNYINNKFSKILFDSFFEWKLITEVLSIIDWHKYTLMYTRTHAHTHTRTHAHAHTRTHARTHTHTRHPCSYRILSQDYCVTWLLIDGIISTSTVATDEVGVAVAESEDDSSGTELPEMCRSGKDCIGFILYPTPSQYSKKWQAM